MSAPSNPSTGVVAFPGAEGFGAHAIGGRGGAICRVTTLAKAGAGSLQACFDATGRRTVVFDVSGVIEGPLEIKHGQLTIAGQTSPSGVVIKGGVVCDNVYDPNDCNDLIVRHVRFRGGNPDSFRIGGAHDVILDHCSFASAEDENIEITRSKNVTVQYAMIAEPKGEHYKWGGVLLNYSKDVMPLDAITIHHSVWSGVAGRLPELSCEENGDGPGKTNCAGRILSIELANNVLWDASDPIWFNRCTGTNEGNDCPPSAKNFGVRLNLVGNVFARRSSADAELPFIEPAVFASPEPDLHARQRALPRRGPCAERGAGRRRRAPRVPADHVHVVGRARRNAREDSRRLPPRQDGHAPRGLPRAAGRRAPAVVAKRAGPRCGGLLRHRRREAALARHRSRRDPRRVGDRARPRPEIALRW